MKLLEEKKAQTSIELLLLLGGAILVAVAVGIALKSIGTNTSNEAVNATQNAAKNIK